MTKPKTALIMVDLQNDFCSGGSLAVREGDKVIPLANQLQPYFDLVIASKDWHPADHMSFASNQPGHSIGEVLKINDLDQVLWPDHCVQGTPGAEFHPLLNTDKIHKIFYKGTDKTIDSYSAFFDNAHMRATGLGEYLKQQGITQVYIMGLATDYCVKYSCLDAIKLGFEVYMIEDACRGVELKPGDIANAIQTLKAAGIKIITTKNL